MKALGQSYTNAEIQEMMAEVDEDGSGTVDFPELIALFARKMKDNDTQSELISAFNAFDKDNTGEISVDQLGLVMSNLGDKLTNDEIQEMLREADLDGNGSIDREEFVKMMMAQ